MEVEALELGDCIGIIYFILNRGFVNSILRAVQQVSLAVSFGALLHLIFVSFS